jgi:hypothetical protein
MSLDTWKGFSNPADADTESALFWLANELVEETSVSTLRDFFCCFEGPELFLPDSFGLGTVSPEDDEGFSSCNRFSRPSTRFNSASSTSVLGPRFFGTASVARDQQLAPFEALRTAIFAHVPNSQFEKKDRTRTVNTRALEDTTGLTAWSGTIALDLKIRHGYWCQ